MTSEPGNSDGDQPPKPRDKHAAKTAGKALIAIPGTMAMPFVITFTALRSIWRDRDSRSILVAAGMLLVAGTLIFMVLEGLSLVDGFYFSFITLATIGYGDISPTTDVGKIVTVIYGIAGLGVMAALISRIATLRPKVGRRDKEVEDESENQAD